MRYLLYILLAILLATFASCKTTTKVVTLHDTLHVERAVVQEVYKHDTLTIHDSTEIVREVVRYDTLGRVKEVVRVQYRNRYVQEQGGSEVKVVHDTITIKQGSTASQETKPSKPTMLPIVFIAGVLVAMFGWIYHKTKDW